MYGIIPSHFGNKWLLKFVLRVWILPFLCFQRWERCLIQVCNTFFLILFFIQVQVLQILYNLQHRCKLDLFPVNSFYCCLHFVTSLPSSSQVTQFVINNWLTGKQSVCEGWPITLLHLMEDTETLSLEIIGPTAVMSSTENVQCRPWAESVLLNFSFLILDPVTESISHLWMAMASLNCLLHSENKFP